MSSSGQSSGVPNHPDLVLAQPAIGGNQAGIANNHQDVSSQQGSSPLNTPQVIALQRNVLKCVQHFAQSYHRQYDPQIINAESRVKTLQDELLEAKEVIKGKEEELEMMNESLEHKDKELKKSHEQIAKSKQLFAMELEKKDMELAKLREQLAEQQKLGGCLEDRNLQLTAENQQLKEISESAFETNATCINNCLVMQDEISKLKEESEKNEQINSEISKKMKIEEEKHNVEIEKLRKKNEGLENQIQSLKDILKEKNSQNEGLKAYFENIKQSAAAFEANGMKTPGNPDPAETPAKKTRGRKRKTDVNGAVKSEEVEKLELA